MSCIEYPPFGYDVLSKVFNEKRNIRLDVLQRDLVRVLFKPLNANVSSFQALGSPEFKNPELKSPSITILASDLNTNSWEEAKE